MNYVFCRISPAVIYSFDIILCYASVICIYGPYLRGWAGIMTFHFLESCPVGTSPWSDACWSTVYQCVNKEAQNVP